jgi:hypothetical protein
MVGVGSGKLNQRTKFRVVNAFAPRIEKKLTSARSEFYLHKGHAHGVRGAKMSFAKNCNFLAGDARAYQESCTVPIFPGDSPGNFRCSATMLRAARKSVVKGTAKTSGLFTFPANA